MINFKRGETEALFQFTGAGAAQAKKRVFVDAQGVTDFESRGVVKKLAATAQYKHIGTLTCSTGSMHPEISAKVSAMQSVFKQLRFSVFQRRANPVETRLSLCQGVVFARGYIRPAHGRSCTRAS